MRPRVIVLGNQKGGSGKSTTAMHVIVGLMNCGYAVGSVDLDGTQATLTHFVENRQRLAEALIARVDDFNINSFVLALLRGLESEPSRPMSSIHGIGPGPNEALCLRIVNWLHDAELVKIDGDIVQLTGPGRRSMATAAQDCRPLSDFLLGRRHALNHAEAKRAMLALLRSHFALQVGGQDPRST